MPSGAARSLKRAAPLFAALGDEVRLRLVTRLCDEGPLSIAQLADGSGVTRQAISKHLRVLEQAGLVTSTRDGRENICQLEPRRLHDARACLGAISSGWDRTLGRLKAFVESHDERR